MQTATTGDLSSSCLRLRNSQAQEVISQYFLDCVTRQPPTDALESFANLFIEFAPQIASQNAYQALYDLLRANQERDFCLLLKRVFFILVNNWETSRQTHLTNQLIDLFKQLPRPSSFQSTQVNRLRVWLNNFVASPDYQELLLYVTKFDEAYSPKWVQRYSSYFLMSQALDLNNSVEQRCAARIRAKILKDQFKFNLALYTARTHSATLHPEPATNPTQLSDNLLKWVKKLLVRQGQFSYANIANIFIQQTQQQTYQEFKQSLRKYLKFSVTQPQIIQLIDGKLASKIGQLYVEQEAQALKPNLLLRTCNRAIDFLIMETKNQPSDLFVQLISQGNPLSFVLLLVKLILICPSAQVHLEKRITDLLEYYKELPESQGQWLLNFLDILNVALAIYAGTVQYNLIDNVPEVTKLNDDIYLKECRVFSLSQI